MGTQLKNYYLGVMQKTWELDGGVSFSVDEIDIIEDFEMQGFSEQACAEHLLKYRKT